MADRNHKRGRKQGGRPLHDVPPVLIGAGITEKWYFRHLRQRLGLRLQIKDRYFGSEKPAELSDRIDDVLSGAGEAICCYDADTALNNPTINDQLKRFREKYKDNQQVLLCESLPSIEYWFLLHFCCITKLLPTADEAIRILRQHLPDYDKTEHYLRQTAWVDRLCADGQSDKAAERAQAAEHCQEDHSYSHIYRALKLLSDRAAEEEPARHKP